MPTPPPAGPLTLTTTSSCLAIDGAAWDELAGDADPFLRHAFFAALEQSGSIGGRSGWTPMPLLATDGDGKLAGVAPLFAKQHSQGEYVFDHAWADAWERAGGRYYPKLQIAVPFTPVPGRRLLTRDPAVAAALIDGVAAIVADHGYSSAHATFIDPSECDTFQSRGWLLREGLQYHWHNAGYRDFDDFLATMPSRKRKGIRKERAQAQDGVIIHRLTGSAITERHWDAFWHFYQDTGARKWGRPYLTRSFFSLLGGNLADHILLVIAEEDGLPIAGALNLIGRDSLYGRYWGAIAERPCLHFELCYYQAIDFAIERGLGRVEAGAQGEHKIARGYAPVTTWSAHYIPHDGFRAAVADFLERERSAIRAHAGALESLLPFRAG